MSNFQSNIESVSEDTTHGSTYLLEKIIRAFMMYKPKVEERKWAFHKLLTIDASMTIVHHFLNEIRDYLKDDSFQKHLENYQKQWLDIDQLITEKLKEHLPDRCHTFLLHSHSQMVIKVLSNLQKENKIKLIQTTSHPGGEGKESLSVLRKMGFQVALIEDHDVEKLMTGIDCIILGVDHYDKESFVNKVGSLVIVDIAKRHNKPVFVLGDRRKYKENASDDSELFEKIPLQNHVTLIT